MSGPLRPPPGAATEEQRELARKYPALSSFKHITDEVARRMGDEDIAQQLQDLYTQDGTGG